MRNFILTVVFPLGSLFGELPLSDLSLESAECIAREYNKQLLIAKEGTEQAKERKLQAISMWLPSLHYRGEFFDSSRKELLFDIFDSTQPFTPAHQGYSSILEFAQPLFSSDLIFNLRSKQIEQNVVSYEQASTLNELLLAVRKSYYSVVTLEIALGIERENVRYLSYALEQEQGKLDAGNSTTLEVNQSKVAVANAISRYYSALRDLKSGRNAFVLTLGIDPMLEPQIHLNQQEIPIEKIPELAFKLQEVDHKYRYFNQKIPSTADFLSHIDTIDRAKNLILFSEREASDYLELALRARPDLIKTHLQIDVAEQNLNEKQGHYLPTVKGYARYSYNDQYIGPVPFGQQTYNWCGGVILTWNLFDSFLREHEIKEARSLRQSYRLNYDKTYQRVEVEIRNGLYQLEESIMAYLSSTQAVFLAEQASGQAADKLRFGKIPPLEYRDSVNLLLQSRNQRNKASYDLITSYYQLRYSTGADVEQKF